MKNLKTAALDYHLKYFLKEKILRKAAKKYAPKGAEAKAV